MFNLFWSWKTISTASGRSSIDAVRWEYIVLLWPHFYVHEKKNGFGEPVMAVFYRDSRLALVFEKLKTLHS